MKLKSMIVLFSLLLGSLGQAQSIDTLGLGKLPEGPRPGITIPPIFPMPKPNPVLMGDGSGGVTVGGGNITSSICGQFLAAHLSSTVDPKDYSAVLSTQREITLNILTASVMLERRDSYRPLLTSEGQALEIVRTILVEMSDLNRSVLISACQPQEKLFYTKLINKSHVQYLQAAAEYLAATSDLLK